MTSSLDTRPMPPRLLELPELTLVVLVGASSAGKSHFVARHFAPTEVLSSDFFRALVSDDENRLDATADALDCLMQVAGKRLARGRLTVVDAPSLRPEERRRLVELARQHDVPVVAVVLDLPRSVLETRQAARPDRTPDLSVIGRQVAELRRTRDGLPREGFHQVWVLSSPEEVTQAQVRRVPLPVDRKELRGPFDFIGDVHGCLEELRELLEDLGYRIEGEKVTPPAGRMAAFVGDLVDRGPDSVGVLRLVMGMVASGAALCVPGNHDEKLKRALEGKAVKPLHGLDDTLAQLAAAGDTFQAEVQRFIGGLVSHLVLDGGRVVVAHAGLPEHYQGRSSRRVRSFALYGDVDGRTDEYGMPLRGDWAADYRGEALVVYGHTPIVTPQWINRTLDIDTGCAFGGHLTALRYPELELRSVAAKAQYAVPSRPLRVLPGPDTFNEQQFLQGGRIVTRTLGGLQLRAAERLAALETAKASRVDPRWCVYLPPALSAPEPGEQPGWLERPEQAFNFYRQQGVSQVSCQEKPWGQRAMLVVCRNAEAAQRRFGVAAGMGCLYDDRGRPSLPPEQEKAVIERARQAAVHVGLWETLKTDWFVLEVVLDSHEGPLRVWLLALLASEGEVYVGREGRQSLALLAEADPQLFRVPGQWLVALGSEAETQAVVRWETLTSGGGAGMVVRPSALTAAQLKQVQPGLEVRSPAALLHLFGADADLATLAQQRKRVLGAERARALRQFHLGWEALSRFVDAEGFGRVRECVLGVLALGVSGAPRDGSGENTAP